MNVLIDSGNCQNVGDNAMLINVQKQFMLRTDWTLFVIKKYDERSGTTDVRVKHVRNNNDLLVMPNWRINCEARLPLQIIFWIMFLTKSVFLTVDAVVYNKFKKHIVFNEKIKYWSEIINNMDAYWVVGGGYINDMGLGPVACKMLLANVFSIFRKPVIFSGQTIGPLKTKMGKLILKISANSISMLSLREGQTFDLLRRLHISLRNTFITADDALTLGIDNGRSGCTASSDRKIIAVNLRLGFYNNSSQAVVEKFSLLLTKLMNEFPHHHFMIIPIAFGKDDSDINAASRLLSVIPNNENRISIYEGAVDAINIQSIIRTASMSIGVSYHFCLFSLSNGIPTIGIYADDYYRQKIDGLMGMFNEKDACFDLMMTEINWLVKMIVHKYDNFSKESVFERKRQMVQQWDCFLCKGIQLINNPS